MLPLILVGFVMMTVGVALLCLGEVPLVAGKRIPALRSRLIGLVLVSFLPLAWGARQGTIAFFGPDEVEGPVVTWSLFGVSWFVVFLMLFRVLVPKRQRRTGASSSAALADKNPFGNVQTETGFADVELAEETPELPATRSAQKPNARNPAPAKNLPAKKPSKPSAPENDPFDFT
jgi:hypothetical protein